MYDGPKFHGEKIRFVTIDGKVGFERLEVEMVGSTPADTIRLKIIQEQFPKKTLGMQLRDAVEMSNEAHGSRYDMDRVLRMIERRAGIIA